MSDNLNNLDKESFDSILAEIQSDQLFQSGRKLSLRNVHQSVVPKLQRMKDRLLELQKRAEDDYDSIDAADKIAVLRRG